MKEVLLGMLGSGAAISLIGIILQVWQKQKGTDIDWYDRAVGQVKAQDEVIQQLKKAKELLREENLLLREENRELKSVIENIENLLEELEQENEEAKRQLMEYKREELKWRK